jgi:NADH pyrophosphatase NudC (nudix superfamily)
MELGAIFLVLAVLVLVGLFVSRPLIENRRAYAISAEEHEISHLLAERDSLITSLQELDFDHVLGKIPAEDYPNMRSALLTHAADVLRRIDELQPQKTAAADAESRVEAAIAARRADASAAKLPASALDDDDLEGLIAARRAQHKEKTGGFCPNCGKPVLRSDRFCPSCGKAVR